MDDEFVDTSDCPVISHCDPQHPTAVSSTQPAALQEWLDDSPLLTWHLHQCYSPMAEDSWGLKHVEDLLTSNYSWIVGYGWMWMEDDEPHDCSLSKPIIETRSDLKSVHLGQRWAMFDLIKPFRGWIQVFSPNHPPKKVLAVGCGISMAVLGRISKHKKTTHILMFSDDMWLTSCLEVVTFKWLWVETHGIPWWTQQNSW